MGRLQSEVTKERAIAQLAAISPGLFEASLPSASSFGAARARSGVACARCLGVVAGSALALALARSVRSLVFGIEPSDPLTLLAAGLVLGLVGLGASFLPARRASRLDPVVALHQE